MKMQKVENTMLYTKKSPTEVEKSSTEKSIKDRIHNIYISLSNIESEIRPNLSSFLTESISNLFFNQLISLFLLTLNVPAFHNFGPNIQKSNFHRYRNEIL